MIKTMYTLGQTEAEFAAAREVIKSINDKASGIIDSLASIEVPKLNQGVLPYSDISSIPASWWVVRRIANLISNRLQEMSGEFTKFITPATSVAIGNTMLKAGSIVDQALQANANEANQGQPAEGTTDYINGVTRSVTAQAEIAGAINQLRSIVSQFGVGGAPSPVQEGPTPGTVAAAAAVVAGMVVAGFALGS